MICHCCNNDNTLWTLLLLWKAVCLSVCLLYRSIFCLDIYLSLSVYPSIYTLHWICSSESMRASSWCSTVSSSVLIKGYRLLRETFLSFDLAFVYKCRVVRWIAWGVGIAMGILLHGNRVAMVLIKSINVPVMSAVHIWNYTHKLYTYGFNYIIDSDVFLMWKIQRNNKFCCTRY